METLQGFETWFFGGLITILLSLLVYFVKKYLDRMETRLEEHDQQLNDHETRLQLREFEGTQTSRILEKTNELLGKLQFLNGK